MSGTQNLNLSPLISSYLDVRHLLLLTVLASTRSVTRAAERLGQTQPTASIGLRHLREKFNDPLFVRTKAGMSPTPRAEKLLIQAQHVLEMLQTMAKSADVFDAADSSRSFRVCVPDSSHMTLFPRLLQRIRTVAPRIRVEALPVDNRTAQLLESGDADLAIGGFVDGMEVGFYQQVLFSQDFVCLASSKHPRIKGRLTLAAYLREAHIEVSYGKVNELIESELKTQGIERRCLLALPGFLGIAAALSETDMIATVPRQVAEGFTKNFELQVLACPFRIPAYKVRQYWHARMHSDGANQWLRNLCAELFGT
ncbi:MAG: LysR family transcriptional regulator [Ramlibacter sp.]